MLTPLQTEDVKTGTPPRFLARELPPSGQRSHRFDREMLDRAFHVPVDLSRIARPAHERSHVPQNRCLVGRVSGKAPGDRPTQRGHNE